MRNRWRSFLQSTLKLCNSVLTIVGVAMILYSLWMLKQWSSQQHAALLLRELAVHLPRPWFIYTFLSMGIIICFITFSGHIVAETANSLSLAIWFPLAWWLLGEGRQKHLGSHIPPKSVKAICFQAGFAAYVILKKNWESDIPEDPTGQLDHLKDFLRTNFGICRCVGLFVLVVQVLNVFLASILCAFGSDVARDHDNENDFTVIRSDLKQSFLIRPDSQPTVNPEPGLSQIDNHGIGVSEFLSNQVD